MTDPCLVYFTYTIKIIQMKVDISLGSDGLSLGSDGLLYKYEFLLVKKLGSESRVSGVSVRSGHRDRIPIRFPGTDFTIKSTDLEPRKQKRLSIEFPLKNDPTAAFRSRVFFLSGTNP